MLQTVKRWRILLRSVGRSADVAFLVHGTRSKLCESIFEQRVNIRIEYTAHGSHGFVERGVVQVFVYSCSLVTSIAQRETPDEGFVAFLGHQSKFLSVSGRFGSVFGVGGLAPNPFDSQPFIRSRHGR